MQGIAEKCDGTKDKASWTPVKKGDRLGALMLVRTGLGAEVRLAFSDRCRMTIRQASKVGIREFYMKGAQATGRLGLKYGSVKAKVDSAAGPNDFEVDTPVATLSVRGSGGYAAMWGDLGLYFRGTSGQWQMKDRDGSRGVGKGEWTNDKLARSGELLAMFREAQMGDPSGGLTHRELRNMRRFGGGRGIINFVGNGSQFTQLMQLGHVSSAHHSNDRPNDYQAPDLNHPDENGDDYRSEDPGPDNGETGNGAYPYDPYYDGGEYYGPYEEPRNETVPPPKAK
ncbi:MAG: FecR domain-containing protein [Phycisphaerae bacterium]